MPGRLAALLTAAAVAASVLIPVASASAASERASAAAAQPANLEVTGYLTRTSEHVHGHDRELGETPLFRVVGKGYLRVDVSGVELGAGAAGKLTLGLAAPATVAAIDDADARFEALAAASFDTPVKVVDIAESGLKTKGLVNQTPAAAARHKVYAVLVTPKNVDQTRSPADQTVAAVKASVAHSDEYWMQQSGGKVGFDLVGTVPLYNSAYSCDVDVEVNADRIWAEAAKKATAELGYQDAQNAHLALFFPSAADCGGAIGLGTIGWGINTGGLTWTIGTDALIEQATLAHELGHNLSFGHASWLDCAATAPQPGVAATGSFCQVKHYGDVSDVMGYGLTETTGGALSSPSAIRANLWNAADYAVTSPGSTTSHTLNSVSSNTGKRAVVVQAADGVEYFVEYRNRTDEDAPLAAGYDCPDQTEPELHCTAPATDGIRVLRVAPSDVKGFPGDDSYLIGRRPVPSQGLQVRTNYVAGETFATQGVSVNVTAVSGATATVSVTAPSLIPRNDEVYIQPTASYDGKMRVGDTWTAILGDSWRGASPSFQWYRATSSTKVAIAGATGRSYKLTTSDLGRYISVVASVAGAPSVSHPGTQYAGYGPISAGVVERGYVSIDASETPLKAVLEGWRTGGESFMYQWYRSGEAISGATSSTYTPSTKDAGGARLRVRVTASKSGYTSISAYSAYGDFSLTKVGTGAAAISGDVRVGSTLTASSSVVTTPASTPKYQWYRGSKAISGATASTYMPTSSDYGFTLRVRALHTAPGRAPLAVYSPYTAKVAAGVLEGSRALPIVTQSSTKLTAALVPGSITTPSVKLSYQWYRDSSAISKATSSSYTMTGSDYGHTVSVRVTVSKTAYSTVRMYSEKIDYSIYPSEKIVISGIAKVGETLTATQPDWNADLAEGYPAYRWYRSGTAISGATSPSYTLTASDYGKTITAKVTARATGRLSYVKSTSGTAKVGRGSIPAETPTVIYDGTRLQASYSAETAVKAAYQWYRGTKAIKGATKSTYTTSTPVGVKVKVTLSKKAYTTRAWTVEYIPAP